MYQYNAIKYEEFYCLKLLRKPRSEARQTQRITQSQIGQYIEKLRRINDVRRVVTSIVSGVKGTDNTKHSQIALDGPTDSSRRRTVCGGVI